VEPARSSGDLAELALEELEPFGQLGIFLGAVYLLLKEYCWNNFGHHYSP